MADLDKLMGERVAAVFVDSDGDHIGFQFVDGRTMVFAAVGDCCSRSWVERVTGAAALVGCVVLAVEDRELPTPEPTPAKYDCLAVYSHVIRTERGECEIEYRNDSNGYYGGWLQATDAAPPSVPVGDDWTCNDAAR